MIEVTRLNGTKVYINALLIETIEEVPDTIVTLLNGKKVMAAESAAELIARTQEYLRGIGLVASVIRSEQLEGP
ncbi:MAG: flagellar protein D [Thermobacillus sp. ZCTH02-B1]|uniref:flagellar FlbD family protein n=1 Tax=Thermobacillus sp. ZCTH02-B1 TaxID=1858795 RepID=UPI000B57070E|nr:flagellar FlbD family protein [Thermobacillus sp. ZCTH02-B1]OUM96974.1 MAG: flagellar protein D [Thermobacillus sp. ZCTH02-B1]